MSSRTLKLLFEIEFSGILNILLSYGDLSFLRRQMSLATFSQVNFNLYVYKFEYGIVF